MFGQPPTISVQPQPGFLRGIAFSALVILFIGAILLIIFRERIWPVAAVVNPSATTANGLTLPPTTLTTADAFGEAANTPSPESLLNDSVTPAPPNLVETAWAIATRGGMFTETNTPPPSPVGTAKITETPYPSSTPETVLFEDTFNEGFSNAWKVVTGKVESTGGYITTGQETWIEVGDPEWTDYIVEIHVENAGCDQNTVIAFRYQDLGNYVGLLWGCDAWWQVVNNSILSQHSQGPFFLGAGDVSVRISVIGNHFTVIGVRPFVEYTDFPSGKVAIRLAPRIRYDYVRITKP